MSENVQMFLAVATFALGLIVGVIVDRVWTRHERSRIKKDAAILVRARRDADTQANRLAILLNLQLRRLERRAMRR